MRGSRSLLLAAWLALWGCGSEPAEPAAVTPPAPERTGPRAAAPAPGEPAEAPPRAPEPTAGAQPPSEPEAEEASGRPPLAELLKIPAGEPARVDPLASPPAAPLPGEASPSKEDSPWKDRVRVEGRSEQIGPTGPRQGRWSETEAGVRVPVDEEGRVVLEGGVRMESREEPQLVEPERKSQPKVGVEVRF